MAAKRTAKAAASAETASSIVNEAILDDSKYSSDQKQSDKVMISIEDAQKIYELYHMLELADSHFHTCQSASFRQHMQAVYKAKNVSAAFGNLKAGIDSAKGES